MKFCVSCRECLSVANMVANKNTNTVANNRDKSAAQRRRFRGHQGLGGGMEKAEVPLKTRKLGTMRKEPWVLS